MSAPLRSRGVTALATLALVVSSSTACDRCTASSIAPPTAKESPAIPASSADAAAAAPLRKRKGGTDVTFLVLSDTHFGFGGIEAAHEILIPKLNAIAGRAYPKQVGGNVAAPRGVLVTGDLTEWGKVEEWEPFVRTYGLTGKEGALRLPVFEVIGNHDKVHGPWVEQQVAERHGGHRFYSWDWDDVHFAALGEAPDEEGLAFLARDLAPLARDISIVVYFHLALLGPWSTDDWFAEGTFKDRLAALLEGRAVAGIFHGHHHATDHYAWHGFDVYKPGAVKDGAHTFATVHITDDRMTVASYDWDRDRWRGVHDKSLPVVH